MSETEASAPGGSRLARLPREHGTAFRRAGIAFLALVALAVVAVGLTRTSLFAIEHVEVVGAGPAADQQAILDAARVGVGRPAVSVEEGAIAARVERLPGVADARVSTDWPNKVVITVTERTPAVVARTDNGKWATITSDGVVLSVSDQPQGGLPAAVGPTVSSQIGTRTDDQVAAVLKVKGLLPQSLSPDVVQIQSDSDKGIRLGLKSGLIVIVGSDDSLPDKLTAAAAVLRNMDQAKFETLDVTSPSLPVSNEKKSSASNSQQTASKNSQPSTTTTTQKPRNN